MLIARSLPGEHPRDLESKTAADGTRAHLTSPVRGSPPRGPRSAGCSDLEHIAGDHLGDPLVGRLGRVAVVDEDQLVGVGEEPAQVVEPRLGVGAPTTRGSPRRPRPGILAPRRISPPPRARTTSGSPCRRPRLPVKKGLETEPAAELIDDRRGWPDIGGRPRRPAPCADPRTEAPAQCPDPRRVAGRSPGRSG